MGQQETGGLRWTDLRFQSKVKLGDGSESVVQADGAMLRWFVTAGPENWVLVRVGQCTHLRDLGVCERP